MSLIKKYFVFIVEGAFYGFFAGALFWVNLYLIYETDISIGRGQKLDKIEMSFLSFPVKFLPFCLLFTILASVIGVVMAFFFQKHKHLFLTWLLTGVISIILIDLVILDKLALIPKSVGYGWICCLDNSTGYLFWLITFLMIVLYTFLFVFVRKFITRSPQSMK